MTTLETRYHDQAETIRLELQGPSGRPAPATVVELGSGTPVVFLHGLVGLNEHWDLAVERLSKKLRCILLEIPLLDLRGRDCSVQGVTEMTAQYLRTLKEQCGQAPVLAGNSFGGHVACRIAIDHPELARALILAGSSGLHEKPLAETKRFQEIQTRPSREWIAEKIGELFHDRTKMRDGDLERAHAALNVRGGARAMVRLSRTARKNNLSGELAELKQPTLLIWGKQDIVTPPEAATDFHAGLPNSKLVWIDECGHVPMLEHHEVFAAEALSFIESLPDAAGDGGH